MCFLEEMGGRGGGEGEEKERGKVFFQGNNLGNHFSKVRDHLKLFPKIGFCKIEKSGDRLCF